MQSIECRDAVSRGFRQSLGGPGAGHARCPKQLFAGRIDAPGLWSKAGAQPTVPGATILLLHHSFTPCVEGSCGATECRDAVSPGFVKASGGLVRGMPDARSNCLMVEWMLLGYGPKRVRSLRSQEPQFCFYITQPHANCVGPGEHSRTHGMHVSCGCPRSVSPYPYGGELHTHVA